MNTKNEHHLVYEFFNNHPLMTLATIAEDKEPHSAAVYTYVTEDLNFYFVTKSSTQKFKNILQQPTVAISTYDENFLMFGEVIGRAEHLKDEKEASEKILELQKVFESRKSSYWMPPVTQLRGGEYVIIKIKPTKVSYTNFEQSSSEEPVPYEVNFQV